MPANSIPTTSTPEPSPASYLPAPTTATGCESCSRLPAQVLVPIDDEVYRTCLRCVPDELLGSVQALPGHELVVGKALSAHDLPLPGTQTVSEPAPPSACRTRR